MMPTIVKGQNLIPNSSFELFETCPDYFSQFNRLESWFTPTEGTSDYYNVCSTEGSPVDVPNNFAGQQYPRTGRGYGGIISSNYGTNYNYREYMEVPLISTLIKDSCYQFEMYVNLATISHFTIDTIGAYFSDTLIDVNHYSLLNYTPQISSNNGFIKDTLNWTLISQEYYAKGGEAYLLIGNFLSDSMTNFKELPGCCMPGTYFYVDDVSLTPCTYTGLNDLNGKNDFKLYPNPVTDLAKLEFNNQFHESCILTVFNVHGQAVITIPDTRATEGEIDCQDIVPGIYFFQVKTSQRILAVGKLIKE
jgi:hypothetical protein